MAKAAAMKGKPAMKAAAMKAGAMRAAAMKAGASSKSGLAAAIAAASGLDQKDAGKALKGLAAAVEAEVKKSGVCKVPGICTIKVKSKAATKAGKRMMFGKEVAIKAKAASKVVKVAAAASLKKAV